MIRKINILDFFLILNFFGFPFFVFFSLIIGLDTSLGSIIFRSFIILLSMILIYKNFTKRKYNRAGVLIIIFLFIYFLRLLYDILLRQVHLESVYDLDGAFIIQFFIASTLVPCIAIFIGRNNDFKNFNKVVLYVSITQCLICIISTISMYGLDGIISLSQQRYLFVDGDFGTKKGNPLNPISLSRWGSVLILLLITRIFFQKIKTNILLIISSLLIGSCLLFMGGSKGPFLAMFITLFLMITIRLNITPKNILTFVFSLFTLFIFISIFQIMVNIDFGNLELINRLNLMIFEGNYSGRDLHFSSAINQFLENPVYGDKVFDDFFGYYPHNLILESFMALGLFGGIFYIIITIRTIFFVRYKFISDYFPLYTIFLFYFVSSLSSGGLFNSPELFISMISLNIFFNLQLIKG